MLIKRASDIRSSEITDKKLYLNRREFLQTAGAAAAGAAVLAGAGRVLGAAGQPAPHGRKLDNVRKSPLSVSAADDKVNTWEQITTYNNYYEFGTDKDSPSEYAKSLKTEPWKVVVDGECSKPAAYNLEDILKGQTLEERIYRHRCVEAWSMVIPWVGFPLSDFIKKCEPTSKAKYVEFTTIYDPKQMPRARPRPPLALPRGAPHGRGDAPADDSRRRSVRRGPTEPERRAAPARGALEVRVQAREIDREDPVRRKAAHQHLAGAGLE